MTTTDGIISRLFARLRGDEDLARLSQDEVGRIARDMGVSSAELTGLAAQGPGGSALLYERLAALGLSRADVDRTALGLMRDLERTCSCCGEKKQCAHDMSANPADPEWRGYCPNVDSITAVQGAKGRFPA